MSQSKPGGANSKPPRKAPKKITPDYLHNSGLYYLGRFAASSAHFRRVMMRKVDKSCAAHPDQDRAACAEMVEALVKKFEDSGLLNDNGFAEGTLNSLRRRGLSARAIEAKMTAKGLDREQVRAAMGDGNDAGTELHAALRLARRKKLGPFGTGAKPEEKALAAMARAGFDYETASKALSLTREEAENLLHSLLS